MANNWNNNKKYLIKIVFLSILIYTNIIPNNLLATNLQATCFAEPLVVNIGESVTFRVSVSGGEGNYTYLWRGSETLIGDKSFVTKTYSTTGAKTATVSVFSDNQSVNPTCEIQVVAVNPVLSATCFSQSGVMSISKNVEWQAKATGGNGNYNYSWIGSDNLRGTNSLISKKYDSLGSKKAIVTVTSGEQSVTRSCDVLIENDPVLFGECYADYSSVKGGNPVTWTAKARGGSGVYTYSWSGDENLRGNNQFVSKIYNGLGPKAANITIFSGDQVVTESCFTEIGVVSGSFIQRDNVGLSEADDIETKPVGSNDNASSGSFIISIFKILATIILLIGSGVIFAFIRIMKNRAKEQDKNLGFAKKNPSNKENEQTKDISDLLEREARKKKMLFSADGLEILIKEAKNDISQALVYLEGIINSLKSLPSSHFSGEDRWFTLDRNKVGRFFLKGNVDDD